MKTTLQEEIRSEISLALAMSKIPESSELRDLCERFARVAARFYNIGIAQSLQVVRDYEGAIRHGNNGIEPEYETGGARDLRTLLSVRSRIEKVSADYAPEPETVKGE